MGLIFGIIFFSVLPAVFVASRIAGLVIGVLPRLYRNLILAALTIAALYLFHTYGEDELDALIVLVAILAAAAGLKLGMSEMESRRDRIHQRIGKVLQRTPRWLQIAAAVGVVSAIAYPFAKSTFLGQKLDRDLTSLAGEWYGFDFFYEDGAKYRVIISEKGNVSVHFDRDDKHGQSVEVLKLSKLGPDMIRIQREWHPGRHRGAAILSLTRGDVTLDDWPELSVDHELLETTDNMTDAVAELTSLIRSTAEEDYRKATKRLRGTYRPPAEREDDEYHYLEDLGDQIRKNGPGPIYRLRHLNNVFVTFFYGSAHHVSGMTGYWTCRPVYGLVYGLDDGEWTRLDDAAAERMCAGEDLAESVDSFIAYEYRKLLRQELETRVVPELSEGRLEPLMKMAGFPMKVMFKNSSMPRGEWTEWSRSEFIGVLDSFNQSSRIWVWESPYEGEEDLYTIMLRIRHQHHGYEYSTVILFVSNTEGDWLIQRAEVN